MKELGMARSALSLSRMRWLWRGLLAASVLLPGACRGRHPQADTAPGKYLLLSDDKEFRDEHEHFHFNPPPKWNIQARSAAAPEHEDDDRLLAKFKNLVDNTTPCWMVIRVARMPEDLSLPDCLRKKKPKDWTEVGKIEEFEIKGRPVARAVWKGNYDGYPWIRESTAARRGNRVYFISGEYHEPDKAGRDLIRQATETCEWDDK
jgi:hypothetical protein